MIRNWSPTKLYVARNLGRMHCGDFGVELNVKEIKAVRRLRLVEPLCLACRGYSRASAPLNIDGPLGG